MVDLHAFETVESEEEIYCALDIQTKLESWSYLQYTNEIPKSLK